MARICPLFSSSSGNGTYIGTGSGGILIDSGVSQARLAAALSEHGIDKSEIKGVFITHEHSDHIAGLKTLTKTWNIPVFCSPETGNRLVKDNQLPKNAQLIVFDNFTEVSGINVNRFSTSHDCVGSSGYVVQTPDGIKIGVCTDTGVVTDEIKKSLLGCDMVLIESNHDVMMLQNSRYPYELKRRILGDNGHLSNAHCSKFLPQLVKGGTTRIILGHLSRENNLPELATTAARATLLDNGMIEKNDYLLYVAPPCNGKMILY